MIYTIEPLPITSTGQKSLSEQLMAAVSTMNSTLPLKRVEAELVSPDNYSYLIRAQDDRVWRQDIHVVAGVAYMTFNVTDEFTVAEFSPGRLVRDIIVQMILGGATLIRVVY